MIVEGSLLLSLAWDLVDESGYVVGILFDNDINDEYREPNM